MKNSPNQPAPKNIDEYFAFLPEEAQDVLAAFAQKLMDLVPEAEEAFNYQIPTIKYRGRNLVYYAAYKKHYSFFVGDGSTLAKFAHRTEGFANSSKSALHFTKENPLPDDLVKDIVKSRMTDEDEKLLKKRNKKS